MVFSRLTGNPLRKQCVLFGIKGSLSPLNTCLLLRR